MPAKKKKIADLPKKPVSPKKAESVKGGLKLTNQTAYRKSL